MIIINLKGGIGNQMFQYAMGRKLSLLNKDKLKFDVAGLARANDVGDIYRPFALSGFSVQNSIASPQEVKRLKYPYGVISKGFRWFHFRILRQMHMGWEPSVLKWKGDIYLDGFWQSPKYFEDIRDILLNDFSPKTPFSASGQEYAKKIKHCTAVSIHVRRGDYAAKARLQKLYGACSLSYYKKAIEEISSKVINPVFFVFSDDIAWVKQNLDMGRDVVYVSGPAITDVEELLLMSMCTHNIIANSSFSWWGAWLNQHKEKVVIVPTPWFDTKEQWFIDLIPDSWIRIPKK